MQLYLLAKIAAISTNPFLFEQTTADNNTAGRMFSLFSHKSDKGFATYSDFPIKDIVSKKCCSIAFILYSEIISLCSRIKKRKQ